MLRRRLINSVHSYGAAKHLIINKSSKHYERNVAKMERQNGDDAHINRHNSDKNNILKNLTLFFNSFELKYEKIGKI